MFPFGAVGAPIDYALGARRHMHEYGTTSRQFGAIAVACRKHASLNPNAQMRTPITLEDHQNSRMIADPFRLLDCSLVSVGAGAVIVSTPQAPYVIPVSPRRTSGYRPAVKGQFTVLSLYGSPCVGGNLQSLTLWLLSSWRKVPIC